jgi:hypothetical protein
MPNILGYARLKMWTKEQSALGVASHGLLTKISAQSHASFAVVVALRSLTPFRQESSVAFLGMALSQQTGLPRLMKRVNPSYRVRGSVATQIA